MKQPRNVYESSETTRETTSHHQKTRFNFETFYNRISNKKKPSQTFLEWFIGFFEGDGSWVIRLGDSWKPNRKEIYISIGQKEKNVLVFIQNTFGFGTLISKKASNGNDYWYWCVYSKADLELLAILFAGHFILPHKQKQFIKWIKFGKLLKNII